MPDNTQPAVFKSSRLLHGGDYNPDQWPRDVWDEDIRMMKLAGCNIMSVGVFSWSQLQPAEGTYTFDWLDEVMDRLAENDIRVALATPRATRASAMPGRSR